MTIEITHKEQQTLWRLGQCLDSGIVPVNDVRNFLVELRQKIKSSSAVASPQEKRTPKKTGRKQRHQDRILTRPRSIKN